ncbi:MULTISPECIES: DUF4347 domain-containing protein [unclassified Moorena]|uniref:DUF4347 domain-containing protein n=1 Tax=unclassified Moorena TaxID=2683338 RepID=UPI00257EE532|nr:MULTISPECIES: DUF4347 domain-containing protein [unclassified Moorena]
MSQLVGGWQPPTNTNVQDANSNQWDFRGLLRLVAISPVATVTNQHIIKGHFSMFDIKYASFNDLDKSLNFGETEVHKVLGSHSKTSSTIVFIDSGVDDYQSLVNGTVPEAEVIVLDSTQDGVEEITKALQGRTDITAIHIVSHGSPGCLYLGNSQLSLDTLNYYAPQLKTWSTTDSPTPILLYGCNVATVDAGTEFLERLHQITGTEIAASANRTGNAALGGDWNLECCTAEIAVDSAFLPELMQVYQGVFASLTVDTLVDENDGNLSPGDVSLREAIASISAGGTVNFASSLTGGTIILTQGQLTIDKDLTIEGLGADKLTVSGNNASRVFRIDDGNSSNLINVEIEDLTITGGRISRFGETGAGIFNTENLTLNSSTISNNKGRTGAGIANNGILKLFGSTVSGNEDPSFGSTGGVFSGGGGIRNFSSGSLEIDSSTINNNKASRGGGIYNGGSLKVINSTISGNESADGGGGIIMLGSNPTANVSFSTIINNTGNIGGDNFGINGGVSVPIGTFVVSNSIIAGNNTVRFFRNNADVSGNFTSEGNNLIGNLQGSTGFNASEELSVSVDSVIDTTLQDNGGPTFTHALLDGSPAIDAANPNAGVLIDQRGVTRPQGNGFDIGAFEAIQATPNDDNLTLTPNNDTINLLTGQDIAKGLAGDDFIDGGGGDDKLFGEAGNDTLLGGQGQDKLFGGSGNDLLNGGQGDNILTGGTGKDIFVLSTAGKNTIEDFEDGQDLLKLDGDLTFGSLSIFEQNGNTWITTENNQPLATLNGVSANMITVNDVIF